MTRKKKLTLAILITGTACLALAAPSLFYRATLAWQKRSAHRIFAKLSPEELHSLNTTPGVTTLPNPDPGGTPLSGEQVNTFLLRFPPPQSRDHRGHYALALILTYPQFTVTFLPAFSTTAQDAASQVLYHYDYWTHQKQVNRVRIDDIDAQSDFKSLKNVLLLLTDKPSRFAPYVYFVEFTQHDRYGMIMAVDEKKLRVHAVINFPVTHTACGIFFDNKSGVDPAEVHKFLALIQIEPVPPATTSAK